MVSAARERESERLMARAMEVARSALALASSAMEADIPQAEQIRRAAERLEAAIVGRVIEMVPPPVLVVASNGAWFSFAGERVDLSRRRTLSRVLRRLVEQRLMTPNASVGQQELLSCGWPGETVLPNAGRSRVYSAIRSLRRFGLERVLVTRDGGYLLESTIPIERVAGVAGSVTHLSSTR